MNLYLKTASALLTTFWMLSGCGGGSDGNAPAAPTWNKGEFAAASDFKNFCAAPRSGDRYGTDMHEKMWLRSWSNETYLWPNEIADIDPVNLSVIDYFEQLRSFATTDSGSEKDKFHFWRDTEEYRQLTQSGVDIGYGIEWKITSTRPPRAAWVAFVEPDSPAVSQGVSRGDKLLSINGVDFENGDDIETLRGGLSPSETGQTYQLKFRRQDNTEYTASITSAAVSVSPVSNVKTFQHNGDTVGYLQFNSHTAPAQEPLRNAFVQFANAGVDELVIDMRYNGGGLLYMASQVSYMIAGNAQTNNKFFEQTTFNSRLTSLGTDIFGRANNPTPFVKTTVDYYDQGVAQQNLPSINLDRVFVLTTADTCSASEAIINGLRGIDVEVIQIGETTCGKPYGFYPTDNCGTTYFTIQFSGENFKGFGDYSDGFSPSSNPVNQAQNNGCFVADDLSQPLGDTSEGQLSAALGYMADGSCPAVNLRAMAQSAPALPIENAGQPDLDIGYQGRYLKSIILENKIITPELNQQ